jgi:hypothetical protein
MYTGVWALESGNFNVLRACARDMGVTSSVRLHQTPTGIGKADGMAGINNHPSPSDCELASVVAPSNSSNMRHCCGRPSVASYKARVQGWEFCLARHWSRLAQTDINLGPTTG